jgi:hypothetical protein
MIKKNRFLTPDEITKSMVDIAKKHGAEYQKKTGCSDEKRSQLEAACVGNTFGSIK